MSRSVDKRPSIFQGNGTNVSVVKAALRLMGQDCGHVRPPGAWPLTERHETELRHRLGEWGLLAGSRAASPGGCCGASNYLLG